MDKFVYNMSLINRVPRTLFIISVFYTISSSHITTLNGIILFKIITLLKLDLQTFHFTNLTGSQ